MGGPNVRALERAFERRDGAWLARHALAWARRGVPVAPLLSGHPFEDEWREFLSEALIARSAKSQGHLYVAGNPSQNGFYKVGQTRLDPATRIKHLTREGVVGEFVLVHSVPVPDRGKAEALVHLALDALGWVRHKEFVHAPYGRVVDECERVARQEEKAWRLARQG